MEEIGFRLLKLNGPPFETTDVAWVGSVRRLVRLFISV